MKYKIYCIKNRDKPWKFKKGKFYTSHYDPHIEPDLRRYNIYHDDDGYAVMQLCHETYIKYFVNIKELRKLKLNKLNESSL